MRGIDYARSVRHEASSQAETSATEKRDMITVMRTMTASPTSRIPQRIATMMRRNISRLWVSRPRRHAHRRSIQLSALEAWRILRIGAMSLMLRRREKGSASERWCRIWLIDIIETTTASHRAERRLTYMWLALLSCMENASGDGDATMMSFWELVPTLRHPHFALL